MIKSFIEANSNLNNIFYKSADKNKSYKDLYEDLKKISFPPFKGNDVLLLLAKNNYQTYLYFLKALELNLPCFLIPEYFYNSDVLLEYQLPFISKENILNSDEPHIRYSNIGLDIGEEGVFIIRTSGSTGIPKLIVHRTLNFIHKYKTRNKSFKKTLAFSPLDSIAGVETLLECIVLGKTLVSRENSYAPNLLTDIIIKNEIDYLQTTPSFLNLLTITKQIEKFTSSKLEKIDFGSEPPLPETLHQLKKDLPKLILNHTYGMSEIGILPTITHVSNPLLIKFDEAFSKTLIKDNILYVKTNTMFLKYLNHEAVFEDKYFKTFDFVEEFEGWIQIKGRHSEQINIGGRKFFPIELESLLNHHPDILDCTVVKMFTPFIGEIVKVKIELKNEVSLEVFQENFGEFLKKNVPQFMTPQLIEYVKFENTPRLKKMRK